MVGGKEVGTWGDILTLIVYAWLNMNKTYDNKLGYMLTCRVNIQDSNHFRI